MDEIYRTIPSVPLSLSLFCQKIVICINYLHAEALPLFNHAELLYGFSGCSVKANC